MATWKERAEAVIAQGTGTYSKRWDQYVEGVYESHSYHGRDGVIGFLSGEKIDFVCGLGSNITPGIINNCSVPFILEVELAEMIRDRIKCIDKLKFLKSGSDACQAAVRIARAYTGKNIILGLGYHGWHNIFISAEKPGAGTVEEGYLKYDTIDKIIDVINSEFHMDIPMKISNQIAAVIIEPVMLDLNVRDKLLLLRETCTKNGILLIFDEVITGWRVPQYCIANYFNIHPDLICLGKAMANGYPISVVGGRKDIMDTEGYFISTTFSGERTSIVAAIENITYITTQKLEELWTMGRLFQNEFNAISDKIQIYGYPTRAVWKGEETYKAIFWQEAWKAGYFLGKAWFLSFNHTKDILDKFIVDSKDIIKRTDSGLVKLEGNLPREVFKRV